MTLKVAWFGEKGQRIKGVLTDDPGDTVDAQMPIVLKDDHGEFFLPSKLSGTQLKSLEPRTPELERLVTKANANGYNVIW